VFRSKRKRAENLMENGHKAVGTVTSVQDTGMTVNDNPRVKLTFMIEPLDGSPPFNAAKKTTVSRVQIPQAGCRYPVWFDPSDPTNFAFAMITDPSGRTQIAAMFGDAFGPNGEGIGLPAAAAPAAAPSAPAADDPVEKLRKLGELHQAGVITAEEFEAKKAELLSQM
jgi:hypothetical protein